MNDKARIDTAVRALKSLFSKEGYDLTDELAAASVQVVSKYFDPNRAEEIAGEPLVSDSDGPFEVSSGSKVMYSPERYVNACQLGEVLATDPDENHIIKVTNNRKELVATYVGPHAQYRVYQTDLSETKEDDSPQVRISVSMEFCFDYEQGALDQVYYLVHALVKSSSSLNADWGFYVRLFRIDSKSRVLNSRQDPLTLAVRVTNGKVTYIDPILSAGVLTFLENLQHNPVA